MNNKINVKELTADERVKIASLLSTEQKKDDIGWMYSQPKVDQDQFLLGKAVKDISQINDLTKEYEESPTQRLARFDMETKLREDPLTLMKQREMEKRVDLLKNTAKVKKLRRLLNAQKNKKEKKHKKKHKKRRHRSSSSSSSGSSSGDELLDAFISIIKKSEKEDEPQSNSAADEEPSPSPPASPVRRRPNFNPNRPSSSSYRPHFGKPERPRMSRDEIEARRNQMMSDAKQHQQERNERSSHHYARKRHEEEAERAAKANNGPSFLRNVKNAHVEQSSLEDSVHRKTSTRQRGEMHSNFLSR